MKDVEIVKHFSDKSRKRIYCVLGVYLTKNGVSIEKEMLAWLTKSFRVYSVKQKEGAGLYEYPALKFAQDLSKKTNEPVLYLHTKGAGNPRRIAPYTRAMWKYEFGKRLGEYLNAINKDEPICACPITGEDKVTWMNGFIANANAWNSIPALEYSNNRFIYEYIFKNSDTKVIGLCRTDIVNNKKIDNRDMMAKYIFNTYRI